MSARTAPTSAAAKPTIGASGLIFGWLAFLIVFGFFTRTSGRSSSAIVLFVYGSILPGVAGHVRRVLAGAPVRAIAGVVAAYLLSGPERKARERKKTGQLPGLPS